MRTIRTVWLPSRAPSKAFREIVSGARSQGRCGSLNEHAIQATASLVSPGLEASDASRGQSNLVVA